MSNQASTSKADTPAKASESPSKINVKNAKSNTSLKRTAVESSSKVGKILPHPKYLDMVVRAITDLKERNGSSRQAILKYILRKYNLNQDPKVVNSQVKLALKRGLENKTLKQSKGSGASGSFRLANASKPVAAKRSAPKKEKDPRARKVAVKKVKSPGKPKAKKVETIVAERKTKQTRRPVKKDDGKTARNGVQKKRGRPKRDAKKNATTAKSVGLRTAKKIAEAAKGKVKKIGGRTSTSKPTDGPKTTATA